LIAYFLVLGIAIGFSMINGILVVRMGLPSFITTLGMSSILIGITEWITKGAVLVFPNITSSYYIIGKSKIGGVFPLILLVFLMSGFDALFSLLSFASLVLTIFFELYFLE
jgi:ribose/xylose/arabinose/galactoside ABC-type transport system permease subunit